MIYLPHAKEWINLDKVIFARLEDQREGRAAIFLVFGFGVPGEGWDQMGVYHPDDVNVLNDALNARCADKAGEAFLP